MKPRELQVLIAVLVSFAICAVSVVVFFVLTTTKTELVAPQVPSTGGLSPAVLAELGQPVSKPAIIETKPPIVASEPPDVETKASENETQAAEVQPADLEKEKIEQASKAWNIPEQHMDKVRGFFDKSTYFEWNSASEADRTAFCLVYASLKHPGKPQRYTAGAATYYYAVVQTWYVAKGAPRSLTPKAAIEVALASQTAEEIDREISASTRNLETTIEKQAEKKPTLVLQELKRSSIGDNIRTFDYRLTNESPNMLEDVQIEIECTTIDGKYLGSTKMLIDKLAPGESIIEKAMLEADVKSHELTQIRIIGDHKDKLELTFKP